MINFTLTPSKCANDFYSEVYIYDLNFIDLRLSFEDEINYPFRELRLHAFKLSFPLEYLSSMEGIYQTHGDFKH